MFAGQPVNITAKYRVPKDYPVDLYFLMDLSNSMHDDKQNLEVLGDLLAETMRNLTTSFKLGFGSFVDKNAVPFVEWLTNISIAIEITINNDISNCTGLMRPVIQIQILAAALPTLSKTTFT